MVDVTDVKRIRRAIGMGDADSALFNLFYGTNHLGNADLVPGNQDHQGYTFFTKPNLNLSKDNVKGVRKLQDWLLDDNPNSLASAIRCSLMPRTIPPKGLGMNARSGTPESVMGVRSKAVNDLYPFIPFLSSTMASLSGWPDEVVESFESAPGIAKQVVCWADGRANSYEAFNLDLTCNTKIGDPHTAFAQAWREYMHGVAIGDMNPWPESESEFEIDYQIRCYVLITDKNKKYLQKIACTGGGCYLTGISSGASFNQNSQDISNQETSTITFPLKCVGFRYNDPQIVIDFNKLVIMFNPSMAGVMEPREAGTPIVPINGLTKIPDLYKILLNNKGYPYINPHTSEIEWWVETELYNAVLESQGE